MKNSVLVLKALADESRYRIVELLLTHDLCVGALAHRLGLSNAAISQHLKVLRRAGLVRGEKRGYWTHYWVERDRLRKVGSCLGEMADVALSPEGICPRASLEKGNHLERRAGDMCCKDCCEPPEKLKERPEAWTPEQIKECHGPDKDHPCVPEKRGKAE